MTDQGRSRTADEGDGVNVVSRYDRDVLMEVVVYHHKVRIEGCLCGWSELGKSIGEHVADVYEQCVEARR